MSIIYTSVENDELCKNVWKCNAEHKLVFLLMGYSTIMDVKFVQIWQRKSIKEDTKIKR